LLGGVIGWDSIFYGDYELSLTNLPSAPKARSDALSEPTSAKVPSETVQHLLAPPLHLAQRVIPFHELLKVHRKRRSVCGLALPRRTRFQPFARAWPAGFLQRPARPEYLLGTLVTGSTRGYAGIRVMRADQAARFAWSFFGAPSEKTTPSMTQDNGGAFFRRRPFFAAA